MTDTKPSAREGEPTSLLAPVIARACLDPDVTFPASPFHRELLDLGCVGSGDGCIEFAWEPAARLCNSYGFVHGGFVAMVLDDTAGMAALPALGGEFGMLTAALNVQYLRPVGPGCYRVLGRAVRVGRSLVNGDAEVVDASGRLYARAAGTFVPRPRP